jgi:H+/Cl- antiporter ClcA
MDLKIDLGAKKNLKAPSLSPKTVLLYAILTILIINFAVFLNQWFHDEEIKLDIFIIPSIVGAIFGLIFSFLRLTVERKIAQVMKFLGGNVSVHDKWDNFNRFDREDKICK